MEFPLEYSSFAQENLLLKNDLRVSFKLGKFLENKKIAYCICGGIAATEAVKIIRELRRHGALVQVYTTLSALKFITETSLQWASNQKVITSLSGSAEHIFQDDILLVAPATANMIAKVVSGISDDMVSTLIASALGRLVIEEQNKFNQESSVSSLTALTSLTIVMVPTMHLYLAKNPFVASHLEKLKENHITIIEPRKDQGEEEKLKIPSPQLIAMETVRAFSQRQEKQGREERELKTKNSKIIKPSSQVLITGGSVSVPIDAVRMINNQATGETGIAIASYLYQRGINIDLFLSREAQARLPDYLLPVTSFFESLDDYQEKINHLLKNNKIQFGIFSAAVSDFKVDPLHAKNNKKISSNQKYDLPLIPTVKVVEEIRENHPSLMMMVFKYQAGVSKENLFEIAKEMLKKYPIVIANLKEEISDKRKIRYCFSRETKTMETLNDDYQLSNKIYEIVKQYEKQRTK